MQKLKEQSTKWKRNCPECKKVLTYTSKSHLDRAVKKNSLCASCVRIGKRLLTKESRKKMSDNQKGINNSMYGKSVYDVWLEKYGKKEADRRWKESNEKRSKSLKGTRMGKDNPMYGMYGIKLFIPNYNPEACRIIDEYGKKHGYDFQHAENGGEICVDKYFPDGMDEKRKTIIEIDEKHHFDKDGNLKEKDIIRQQYLENLGYKVIRIKS